jgi:hypothetical protein
MRIKFDSKRFSYGRTLAEMREALNPKQVITFQEVSPNRYDASVVLFKGHDKTNSYYLYINSNPLSPPAQKDYYPLALAASSPRLPLPWGTVNLKHDEKGITFKYNLLTGAGRLYSPRNDTPPLIPDLSQPLLLERTELNEVGAFFCVSMLPSKLPPIPSLPPFDSSTGSDESTSLKKSI